MIKSTNEFLKVFIRTIMYRFSIKIKVIKSVFNFVNLCVFLVSAISTSAASQEIKGIEKIEKEHAIQEIQRRLDRARSSVESLASGRIAECMKAFGQEIFCNCLNENIPWIWDFRAYISITTGSKKENGYDQLPKDRQADYDKVFTVRDYCVRSINVP